MCKYENVQVCKCASLQMCKCVYVQVCKCASMQKCKYKNVQGCKCASMQMCNCVSQCKVYIYMCQYNSVSMQLMAIGFRDLARGISMQTCWRACLSLRKFIKCVSYFCCSCCCCGCFCCCESVVIVSQLLL